MITTANPLQTARRRPRSAERAHTPERAARRRPGAPRSRWMARCLGVWWSPGAAPDNRRILGDRRGERGVVMLWAALTISIIGSLILTGTSSMRTLDALGRADFEAAGHAHEVARAGLTDAYAWFRRQSQQPVESFAPRRDMTITPPVNDTDDPSQGIVRTFEIAPGLWGRYVVALHEPAEPYSDHGGNGVYDEGESFTDSNGNGRWDPERGTRDVTAARGVPGAGSVWLLVARGYVYARPDADLPLGEGRNTVLSQTTVSAEIRRLTVNPPASAALIAEDAAQIVIGERGRIQAAGTAIAYRGGGLTLLPTDLGGEILGDLAPMPSASYATALEPVFGLDWTELRSMADLVVTDVNDQIVGDLPPYALTMLDIDGKAKFSKRTPLRGRGILVVRGDLEIKDGSNSFFSGVIFVEGDFRMRGPAYIRGTVIVRGDVDIQGTSGDYADLEHDPDILDSILLKMGQYRRTKAPFQPAPRALDGRPLESQSANQRRGRWANGGGGGAAAGTQEHAGFGGSSNAGTFSDDDESDDEADEEGGFASGDDG